MLLVDASVYIFRAFHALPDSIVGRDDRPLNAVYGYADFLVQVLAASEAAGDNDIAVAFDESLDSSFRNALFADYKANRETSPAALVAQIDACRELTRALGVATLSSPVYEADDLIGTLAAQAQRANVSVTIVSSDKDLAQLLGATDTLWDFAREQRYDVAGVREKFGVDPGQIPDYLALVGDTVDNIPGVPGIGAKSAAALLAVFADLEAMLAAPDAVAAADIRGSARIAEKLADHAEQARLSRQLAIIVTDIELSAAQRDIARRPADAQALAALCERLGAGKRLRTILGVPAA